jgi:hypothetical protein
VSLPLLIHGLGSIGVFSSRAFLPAFATALLLRFGPHVPWLAHAGLLRHVRDVPTWFTSDAALIALGLLAALELLAERIPEAKSLLDEVHDTLKAGMAALTFLGVTTALDRGVVEQVVHPAGVANYLPALAVAAGTFLATKVRGAVVGPWSEADEDDDLGLQGLLRWVEDLWGGLGPVALVVLPLLTLALFGVAVVMLLLAGRYVEAREAVQQVPCTHCGGMIHASAILCPHCRTPNKDPRAVGLLGGTKAGPADPSAHPYRLFAVKRCPACATRLGRRAVRQSCEACGLTPLDDARFANEYVAFVDRRVPLACLACFLLGLVPVLGVIPAVITYRLAIVAPFRRHIPAARNFLLRWGVRLVSILLVAFQWVPLLGGLLLPALALVNYGAYRHAWIKLARADTDRGR